MLFLKEECYSRKPTPQKLKHWFKKACHYELNFVSSKFMLMFYSQYCRMWLYLEIPWILIGWHLRLSGHGFGWTLGVADEQGGLACCGSWGCKSQTWLSDWTELNWRRGSETRVFSSTCDASERETLQDYAPAGRKESSHSELDLPVPWSWLLSLQTERNKCLFLKPPSLKMLL